MINKLKRIWYRLNSVHVYPEGVMAGDRLFFDFLGTGPYWTNPVVQTFKSWGIPWSGAKKLSVLNVYIVFGNGTTLITDLNADIRRKR